MKSKDKKTMKKISTIFSFEAFLLNDVGSAVDNTSLITNVYNVRMQYTFIMLNFERLP